MKKLMLIALLGATVGSAWGASQSDFMSKFNFNQSEFSDEKESSHDGKRLKLVNKTNMPLNFVTKNRHSPRGQATPPAAPPKTLNSGEHLILNPIIWEVTISNS